MSVTSGPAIGLKQRIKDLLDQFIPDPLKSRLSTYTSARILVGITLINMIASVLTGIFVFLTLELTGLLALAAYGTCLLCIMLYSLSLWILRSKGWYRFAGHLTCLSFFCVILIPVMFTGGFSDSPFTQQLLAIPVYVFLIAGMRGGIAWSVNLAVSMTVLYLLESRYGIQYQVFNVKELEQFNALIPFVIFAMVVAALVVHEYISDRLKLQLKRERNEFAVKASRDHLTGLANRDKFFTELAAAMHDPNKIAEGLALVYLDLDGFKQINDIHGHQCGDQVLKVLAKRLQSRIRTKDIAARLGGDEFALMLSGFPSHETLNKFTERLLQNLSEPMNVDAKALEMHASAGIAIFPDDAEELETLCRAADMAMYRAKAHPNHFCFAGDQPLSSPPSGEILSFKPLNPVVSL